MTLFLLSHESVTREQIRNRFPHVHERALQRYLQDLESGIGLQRRRAGSDRRKSVYFLSPEARPNWVLNNHQYLALLIGTELTAKVSDKLAQSLQELLYRSQKKKLDKQLVQIYEPGLSLGHKGLIEKLLPIIEGIETNHKVLVCTAQEKKREVQPMNLLLHEGRWVLICREWVPDSPATPSKTLVTSSIRIDSMLNTPRVGKRIEFPGSMDPPDSLKSFGPSVGNTEHVVKLRIHGGRGEYFKKEKWHPTQEITSENPKENTLDLKFRVNDLRYFKFLVRRWLPHAEVLSPEELRNTIKDDLRIAAARYQ